MSCCLKPKGCTKMHGCRRLTDPWKVAERARRREATPAPPLGNYIDRLRELWGA